MKRGSHGHFGISLQLGMLEKQDKISHRLLNSTQRFGKVTKFSQYNNNTLSLTLCGLWLSAPSFLCFIISVDLGPVVWGCLIRNHSILSLSLAQCQRYWLVSTNGAGAGHIWLAPVYSPVLVVLVHRMGNWSNPLKNGFIQHTSKINFVIKKKSQ